MAINGIGDTYLTNYSTTANDAISEQLSNQVQSAKSDEQMLDACKQFESYLIQQMFKSMEESAKVFSDDEEEYSLDNFTLIEDEALLNPKAKIAKDYIISVLSAMGLNASAKIYQNE